MTWLQSSNCKHHLVDHETKNRRSFDDPQRPLRLTCNSSTFFMQQLYPIGLLKAITRKPTAIFIHSQCWKTQQGPPWSAKLRLFWGRDACLETTASDDAETSYKQRQPLPWIFNLQILQSLQVPTCCLVATFRNKCSLNNWTSWSLLYKLKLSGWLCQRCSLNILKLRSFNRNNDGRSREVLRTRWQAAPPRCYSSANFRKAPRSHPHSDTSLWISGDRGTYVNKQ